MLLSIFIGAFLLGCAPAAGGTCKREGNIECSEDAHILLCDDGRWVDNGERADEVGGVDGWCTCVTSGSDPPFVDCAVVN